MELTKHEKSILKELAKNSKMLWSKENPKWMNVYPSPSISESKILKEVLKLNPSVESWQKVHRIIKSLEEKNLIKKISVQSHIATKGFPVSYSHDEWKLKNKGYLIIVKYYCPKCKREHNPNNKIGEKHLELVKRYKTSDINHFKIT